LEKLEKVDAVVKGLATLDDALMRNQEPGSCCELDIIELTYQQ
jgi:hypothetical protein